MQNRVEPQFRPELAQVRSVEITLIEPEPEPEPELGSTLAHVHTLEIEIHGTSKQ